MGGGGLYSTAGDYLKFVRMILNGGKGNGNQVLSPETVELMSRNAMGRLQASRMLKTAEPGAVARRGVLPRHAQDLGAELHDQRGNRADRALGGQPRLGRAGEHLFLDRPSKGVGGVYMTQVLPFVDAKALPLFYAFEKSVYQSLG